ncbi:MAG: MFS transporter [Bacteroidota bacterium]
MDNLIKNRQYYKFCFYGFLKNLRFFDAFFILFLLEKGLPFTQIGILYAVREIVINISEIPSGLIADTYGRKRSLTGSFLFYIISFVIFYLAGGFWLFLLAFVLYGIGDAFRSGSHKGMIMDYLKMHQWEGQNINYYGHTRSWSQMGSAISALIAGLIVFYSGTYQNIFLYSIIPYLLNLLLILSYPEQLNRSFERSHHKGGHRLRFTMVSFFRIIRQPKVLKIVNASAIHTAYLKAVKDYIQPLMVNVALLIPIMLHVEAEKKNGIIIGVIYFLIYLLTSRASQLSSKVVVQNKKSISFITLLFGFIFGIATGGLYIHGFWIISLIAFVGIFIVENIRKPILTGFIADQVPNEILTSVISAESLIRTVITAILALLFGIVADNFGIGISFLVISLFLALITVIINENARMHNKRSLV